MQSETGKFPMYKWVIFWERNSAQEVLGYCLAQLSEGDWQRHAATMSAAHAVTPAMDLQVPAPGFSVCGEPACFPSLQVTED